MTDIKQTLKAVIDQTLSADLNPIKDFLFTNPGEPLIATGSGGAETAGDFAALLYGAHGGMATSVSPYTLHSYSDAALISILRRLSRSIFPIPAGTSLSYFAIFTKIFQPDVDLEK